MRPHKEIKLETIAKELGISVVSVSNALRGKNGVSPERRKTIVECAERLGFDLSSYKKAEEKQEGSRANAAGNQNMLIGAIISKRYISVGSSFYWEMYQKMAYAASLRNCFTTLEMVDDEGEIYVPMILSQKEVDGVIIIGPMKENFLKFTLDNASCPVILMDQQIAYGKYSSVLSGNYYGMYRSTRELVRAGHKNIAFVGDIEESRNTIDRYYGFKKCMRESGLKVRRDWIIPGRDRETGRPELKLPDEMPTAFACSSDFVAGILYTELQKRGLRVPEDISIAGYDDYLVGNPLSGHLTTYHVDMDAMARCAIKLVIRECDDSSAAGVIYEIDSDVVIRDSIKRPKE